MPSRAVRARNGRWVAALCLLLAPGPGVASPAPGQKFVVVSVECQGKALVIERRPVEDLDANGVCRERLVAIIDPEASLAVAGSTKQLTQSILITSKPGWPQTFTHFSGGALTLAELDDPRGLATVVGMEDGTIHALAPDGQSLPGWPVPLAAITNRGAIPSALDLLGDPRDELLIGGGLRALSSEGELLPGWPFTGGGASIPVGARFTPEGPVRVIGAGALPPPVTGTTAGTFVLNEFGELLSGWPAVIPKGRFARPLAQGPAVGDVTGDGIAEVVVTIINESQVWVFDSTGSPVDPYPLEFGIQMDDPSLGDLDGDGSQEIVFWMGLETIQPAVIALRGDGTLMPGWPQVTNAIGNFGPAIGDVDGDGLPEVVASTVGGAGTGILGGGVYVWRHDGNSLPGWPKFIDFTGFARLPVIGDVDGDGLGDVVAVGGTSFLPQDTVIYAWKGTGELIAGFPMVIPLRSPAGTFSPAIIADIDRDGIADLGVSTWPGAFASRPARIHWFDLGVPYRPEGMQWPTWAHDHARTGSYSPPVRRVAMEVTLAPVVLHDSLPAPPVTVVATLPGDEAALPSSLFLDKVDGNPVERLEGTRLGGRQAGRLVFQFEGEAVRNRLGGPGQHVLTFRSEVIGGVGGIQFEGEGQIVVSGEAAAGGWGIQRQPGGTR